MKAIKRWVKIIFNPSMTEKLVPHVTRLYVKADCLSLELPDRDDDGNPIIVSYPLVNVFSFARAHVHHVGAELRDK